MIPRPVYQKVGDHLWRLVPQDSSDVQYYYSDETGTMVGPYGDLLTALCSMEFYVMTQLDNDRHAHKDYVYLSLENYETLYAALHWLNAIPAKSLDMLEAIRALMTANLQTLVPLPPEYKSIVNFEIVNRVIEARVINPRGTDHIVIMPDTIKIVPKLTQRMIG